MQFMHLSSPSKWSVEFAAQGVASGCTFRYSTGSDRYLAFRLSLYAGRRNIGIPLLKALDSDISTAWLADFSALIEERSNRDDELGGSRQWRL